MKIILLVCVVLLASTPSWSNPCITQYEVDMGDPDKDKIKCDNGSAEACMNLAEVYALGECGKKRDENFANELLDRACSLGNHQSCVLVAETYYEKDEIKVADYWAKACKKGSSFEVCESAINRYFDYEHYTQGIALLDYTCDKGYGVSCAHLGFVYSGIWPPGKSNLKAKDAFDNACRLGIGIACKQLKVNF